MEIYTWVSYLIMTGIYIVDKDKKETFKDYFFFALIFLFSPLVVPITIGIIIGKYMEEEIKKAL